MIKKIFLSASLVLISCSALGASLPDYYGIKSWKNSKELRNALFLAISGFHQPQKNAPDLINKECPANSSCYGHTPISYNFARQQLYGGFGLLGSSAANYSVSTYYCHVTMTNKDFSGGSELGPMKVPTIRVLNVEHSWPQSHFTSAFPKAVQKGDLHHLFQVLSKVNSIRGNFPYGEVVTPINSPCPEAALGTSKEGATVFEPRDEDKGDMARALFYFSIRYQTEIDADQEAYLRKWHKMDPVDNEELLRNEEIFAIQRNRNPFIDAPSLVNEIDNF